MPILNDVEHEVIYPRAEHVLELEPHREEKANVSPGHRENEIHRPVVCHEIRVERTVFRPPQSLAPGESTMLGCLLGDVESCAIRDAWRPSLKIVVLSPAHFDRLANAVVYVPQMADIARDK